MTEEAERCAQSVFSVALLIAIGLMVWAPGEAQAQATGSIAGVVTDETGAVIPGVTVTITNAATNQSRTTVTGTDGYYSVLLLQPGKFEVKATLAGFKTVTRDDITVTVESTSRVDLKLGVGRVEENVTVSTQAPLVETSNATLGIVIDQKKIVDLPLNGRNFTQARAAAARRHRGARFGRRRVRRRDAGRLRRGHRRLQRQWACATSRTTSCSTARATTTPSTPASCCGPPPDAIQEFKILTHSYSAEYGRNSGSVVNVVTRAGSNAVHGAAWEFNRDDALQARNFFAPTNQAKPKLKQNQFGASFGGPIQRNKMFGFGYYEGHRNTSGQTLNIVVASATRSEPATSDRRRSAIR